MGVVLLLGLVVLFLYLLPFRAGARTRSYAPSAVVGIVLVALVVLFATGLLPWGLVSGFVLP